MLTRIQATNYRCLKHVDQSLTNFQVLVGANGSGKSTFLDVLSFLSELVRQPRLSLKSALDARSSDFDDLVFGRSGDHFELAIETGIPADVAAKVYRHLRVAQWVRYEVRIGYTNSDRREVGILFERLSLVVDKNLCMEAGLRPDFLSTMSLVLKDKGFDHYQSQGPDNPSAVGSSHSYSLGAATSALANLPEDAVQFPIATWFRRFLAESMRRLNLEPRLLSMPAPRSNSLALNGDGSNLPLVVDSLSKTSPQQFGDWIAHLKVALPDLATVRTIERPEDRQRYLVIEYSNGCAVPSWMVSDGTLRLLALTLPAYAMDNGDVFLIEEPENCIHPLAIEIVMQSLNSMYESQVIVTTHSPAILSLTSPENILCFSKSADSGTAIVRGDLHHRMSAWEGTVDPGLLLASGILD